MKQHHDIFSYLDNAFGLVDDDLISSRLDEETEIEITRVYREHPPVSLAKNDAIATLVTHCVKNDET